ncbi:MAG TPA: ABC transporter permease [Blastocatellia bacterium]|nr:ABC transporter permease [Blastocatellia bacterium]HMX25005.1 ABC transporter permease [Blastocatellia bacterium]HMZ19295.1 ABC transporter permease [Blastocatellia bacterium]HNG32753.1 ABC transporter permease [Blastocatellia bacterium]
MPTFKLSRVFNRFGRFGRELSATVAFAVLLLLVGVVAPSFFSAANLRDLLLSNAPVLIVTVGMTMVILAGQIDISVGSQFAVCGIAAGLLAKSGLPMVLVALLTVLIGGTLGSINGWLVSKLKIPAIVVTLATLVAWRDGLRWATEGAWVQGLPGDFQWFGLGQTVGQTLIVTVSSAVFLAFAWMLIRLPGGRAIYAVGSDAEAARLGGIHPPTVTFGVFALMGALVGLAAALNAVRFSSIPANAGIGLEMKAIAAVVVGGAAITGGRGTLLGTLIGVALLGTIGTALTFAGINPFWEKAIQGGIILAALVSDVLLGKLRFGGRAMATE